MKVDSDNTNYYYFEKTKTHKKHKEEDPVLVIIQTIATVLFAIGLYFLFSEELKANLKNKKFTPKPEQPAAKKTDKVFNFTLTVDKLPPTGQLRSFYTKFKTAERTGQWHTVFDLPANYSQEELKTARKRIVRELHSDKLQDNREVADKIMAAFNALSTHLGS